MTFPHKLDSEDALHEKECGVFGVFGSDENAHLLTALGLRPST